MSVERLTPAMQQYLEIKARHKDAVLFFRMGDFYEMFFEDAVLASGILGIALTSRDRERRIPMCGIPYHSAGTYIAKLVKEGRKVAVCEQTENPKDAEGVISRAVTRIITPGMVMAEELLQSKANNYVAAATWNEKSAGLAYADITTGEFRVSEFGSMQILQDEIKRISPSELVLPEGKKEEIARTEDLLSERFFPIKSITYLDSYDFNDKTSLERLASHFNVSSLDGFGVSGFGEGIKAAGALLYYAEETQKTSLRHIRKLTPYYPGNFLILDHSTRKNLEIFENPGNPAKGGTLLSLLDETKTPMGGRMLKSWLSFPLLSTEEIKGRLDSVEELVEKRLQREELERALSQIHDLERIIGRISVGCAGPRDLIALKESLGKVSEVKRLLKTFNSSQLYAVFQALDEVPEVIVLIERSVCEDSKATIKDGGFIKDGFSEELDKLRRIGAEGKDWLSNLEAQERKKTGISNLRVSYNRVFGYYIEVTRTNLKNIPPDYTRKQTLVNAERFVTEQLKEWEENILAAEEKQRALEEEIFSRITKEISIHAGRIQASAGLTATLDCLASFAVASADRDYVKPEVTTGEAIIIEEGRHPVVEKDLAGGFVPNDLLLDCEENQIMILTGPNMAGKSTYIRQVALIVLMAQTGCFVPARKAAIGVVDRIFTRVGAGDDISRGRSTFMVEMSETANILNNATKKSLIILDEVGRGTSTFDGLSIAWAVVEYIHDSPILRSKTLFATHYHELTELSLTKERVKNYNMLVKEWNDKIIFLRKVARGGASRSYGIHVARLAGIPSIVIERADEILRNLERGELNEEGLPKIARGKTFKGQMNIPNLIGSPDAPCHDAPGNNPPRNHVDPIWEELKKLDVNNLTPVEALNILDKVKKMLGDAGG